MTDNLINTTTMLNELSKDNIKLMEDKQESSIINDDVETLETSLEGIESMLINGVDSNKLNKHINSYMRVVKRRNLTNMKQYSGLLSNDELDNTIIAYEVKEDIEEQLETLKETKEDLKDNFSKTLSNSSDNKLITLNALRTNILNILEKASTTDLITKDRDVFEFLKELECGEIITFFNNEDNVNLFLNYCDSNSRYLASLLRVYYNDSDFNELDKTYIEQYLDSVNNLQVTNWRAVFNITDINSEVITKESLAKLKYTLVSNKQEELDIYINKFSNYDLVNLLRKLVTILDCFISAFNTYNDNYDYAASRNLDHESPIFNCIYNNYMFNNELCNLIIGKFNKYTPNLNYLLVNEDD